MRWVVEINDQKFTVEASYGKIFVSGSGELLVDGKQVKAWGASPWGLPKVVPFELGGKPAMLRRRSLMDQKFDLVVDGVLIKRPKGEKVD